MYYCDEFKWWQAEKFGIHCYDTICTEKQKLHLMPIFNSLCLKYYTRTVSTVVLFPQSSWDFVFACVSVCVLVCFQLCRAKICTYIHWRHIQTPPAFWGMWKEVHLSSSVHLSLFLTANLSRKRKGECEKKKEKKTVTSCSCFCSKAPIS